MELWAGGGLTGTARVKAGAKCFAPADKILRSDAEVHKIRERRKRFPFGNDNKKGNGKVQKQVPFRNDNKKGTDR